MIISPTELIILKVYIRALIGLLREDDMIGVANLSDMIRDDTNLHANSRTILSTIVSSFEDD